MWFFLAHLKSKCSWWTIVIGLCPSSVVCHVMSVICFKWHLLHPRANWIETWWEVSRSCRSKLAKIVPIINPRWPPQLPSWKSIFNLFSWSGRQLSQNVVVSIGETCTWKLLTLFQSEIQDWCHSRHFENLFWTFSPEPKGYLTPNLVGNIWMTCGSQCLSWKSVLNFFPWQESQLTRNLIRCIGVTY